VRPATREMRRNGAAQAAGGKSHFGDKGTNADVAATINQIKGRNFVFIRDAFYEQKTQELA
jgi:hypothetical protein